jgi:hypothetical protein
MDSGNAITLAAFKGEYSGASLLAFLCKDVLKIQGTNSRFLEGPAKSVAKASLEKVQRLLLTLEKWVNKIILGFVNSGTCLSRMTPLWQFILARAEVELKQLHKEVSKSVLQVGVTFSRQESKFKVGIACRLHISGTHPAGLRMNSLHVTNATLFFHLT